jgi:hypothetical protein
LPRSLFLLRPNHPIAAATSPSHPIPSRPRSRSSLAPPALIDFPALPPSPNPWVRPTAARVIRFDRPPLRQLRARRYQPTDACRSCAVLAVTCSQRHTIAAVPSCDLRGATCRPVACLPSAEGPLHDRPAGAPTAPPLEPLSLAPYRANRRLLSSPERPGRAPITVRRLCALRPHASYQTPPLLVPVSLWHPVASPEPGPCLSRTHPSVPPRWQV